MLIRLGYLFVVQVLRRLVLLTQKVAAEDAETLARLLLHRQSDEFGFSRRDGGRPLGGQYRAWVSLHSQQQQQQRAEDH